VQLKASLRGHDYETQVQMLSPDGPQAGATSVQAAAEKGISVPSGALPHASTIQQSFGGYDISNIQAHLGPAADAGAAAMGAQAYATGNHVAFASGNAGLHTAAHEAAHVVQQQAGVSLSGGVGQVGDKYETHADKVADAVVADESAEGLLGEMAGHNEPGGKSSQPVQLERSSETQSACENGIVEPVLGACVVGDTDMRGAVLKELGFEGGLYSERKSAVKAWREEGESEDSVGAAESVLVGVLVVAASAATAGASAALFAAVASTTAKGAAAAVTDAMKAASKSSVLGALGEVGERKTRLRFARALEDGLSKEWRVAETAASIEYRRLKQQGDVAAIQDLLDGLARARAGARSAQRGAIVESWLQLVTQSEHGQVAVVGGRKEAGAADASNSEPWLKAGQDSTSVGGLPLRDLYEQNKLTYREYQGLSSHLQTFRPTPDVRGPQSKGASTKGGLRGYLPSDLLASLERATGKGVDDIERNLRAETNLRSAKAVGEAALSPKSFNGWLSIELAEFEPGEPPRIVAAKILGPAGRNTEAQKHLLEGGPLSDFRIAKRIEVGRPAAILLSESNMMTLEKKRWPFTCPVMKHGAHKLRMAASIWDASQWSVFETAGMLFIRDAVIGKSLREHGIRRLGG